MVWVLNPPLSFYFCWRWAWTIFWCSEPAWVLQNHGGSGFTCCCNTGQLDPPIQQVLRLTEISDPKLHSLAKLYTKPAVSCSTTRSWHECSCNWRVTCFKVKASGERFTTLLWKRKGDFLQQSAAVAVTTTQGNCNTGNKAFRQNPLLRQFLFWLVLSCIRCVVYLSLAPISLARYSSESRRVIAPLNCCKREESDSQTLHLTNR